jgi:hypothetical protein
MSKSSTVHVVRGQREATLFGQRRCLAPWGRFKYLQLPKWRLARGSGGLNTAVPEPFV